jgi:hypothetical protein
MRKLIFSVAVVSFFAAVGSARADDSVKTQIEVKGRVGTSCLVVNLDNSAFDFGVLTGEDGAVDTTNHLSRRSWDSNVQRRCIIRN